MFQLGTAQSRVFILRHRAAELLPPTVRHDHAERHRKVLSAVWWLHDKYLQACWGSAKTACRIPSHKWPISPTSVFLSCLVHLPLMHIWIGSVAQISGWMMSWSLKSEMLKQLKESWWRGGRERERITINIKQIKVACVSHWPYEQKVRCGSLG